MNSELTETKTKTTNGRARETESDRIKGTSGLLVELWPGTISRSNTYTFRLMQVVNQNKLHPFFI